MSMNEFPSHVQTISFAAHFHFNVEPFLFKCLALGMNLTKFEENEDERALLHSELWGSLFRGGYMVGKLERSLSGFHVSRSVYTFSESQKLSECQEKARNISNFFNILSQNHFHFSKFWHGFNFSIIFCSLFYQNASNLIKNVYVI